jgi:hypothetical protein
MRIFFFFAIFYYRKKKKKKKKKTKNRGEREIESEEKIRLLYFFGLVVLIVSAC